MRNSTPARPRPVHYLEKTRPPRSSGAKAIRFAGLTALFACLAGGVIAAGLAMLIWLADRTPREWVPALRQAAVDLPEPLASASDDVAAMLLHLDRMGLADASPLPTRTGAQTERVTPLKGGHVRAVTSVAEVTEAVLTARPGDVIVLRPGVYRLNATPIRLTASGAAEAPIVLRAERLGDAVIEADALEAITVLGPFWHIENLVVKGVCDRADDCKDAIHVIDDANDVVISNNRLEDFNTHIKADGQDTLFPDRGRIVGNTLTDTTPRASRKPMAGIDLIGVNDWQIQDNVIADVVREAGAAPTYGASARGAGVNTVFERNVVICAWHNANRAGQQIGISLGGPGTAREMRRDKGQTGFEQVGGSVRDNLIVSCSDHGISLTRAARSVVDRNTLLDTAGIEGRFVETSGTVTANIVDGALRALDGAVLQRWDNDVPWLLSLFLGLHPQRNYYRDPRRLDLAWRQMPAPASERTIRADLCDQPRSALAPAGAFEMYAACQSAAAVAAEPGAASGR